MIALTRKCQYALRALYFLAREYGSGPISISQISAHANAPSNFLETILSELKNAGIVESRRGRRGGCYLLIPPDRVSVGSIVRVIDGPLVTLPCASESNPRPCEDCRDLGLCETRMFMQDVQETVTAILDGISLAVVRERAATVIFPQI